MDTFYIANFVRNSYEFCNFTILIAIWEEKNSEPTMKTENLINNDACDTTGSMLMKKEENHLSGITKRDHLTGQIIKMTNDEFIQKANRIHKDKYDYSLVNYKSYIIKVEIICPKHGKFWQRPTDHLQGKDCVKCGYDKTHLSNMMSHDEWVNKCNVVHNFKYDYSKSVYTGLDNKVILICPSHGEFIQTADAHVQSRGCPKCRTSKGENTIRKWMDYNHVNYTFQKTFDDCRNPKTNRKLKYDFYVPSKNLLIEFDGVQHFKCITTGKYTTTQRIVDDYKYRDGVKTDYANIKNIKLLRIPYTDIKNLPTILHNHILSD
jgi:hypothetical protein